MKKFIVAFVVVFGLLAALALGLYSIQKPKQIIPNKAAVVGGPAGISVSPATSTIDSGTGVTVDFLANLPQGAAIDGFQVVATVSGTIPNDINWQAATPSGMVTVLNSATGSLAGLTIKFAYITQISGSPYTTASTNLGKLTFTAPSSGQTTISFDNTFTKIVEHATSQDLAGIPASAVYTFQLASASPTATASPTSAPTTTPTQAPGACTHGNQSVSLTPSSQSGYRGKGLTYTVTVTNNDDAACAKADFSLSAILPYANWTANFAQTVLSVSPQNSASTTVIFTSSSNSPLGTLPVGVNASGPKSSVVAAANYQVLAPTPTATPKPTPEVVYVPGSTLKPSASPTASATASALPTLVPTGEETNKPRGILANIPTAVIYAVGGFLLIILFFILRALFSGGNEEGNPPKLTPPTEMPTPPQMPPATPMQSQGPMMNPPSISHSVEPPIS